MQPVNIIDLPPVFPLQKYFNFINKLFKEIVQVYIARKKGWLFNIKAGGTYSYHCALTVWNTKFIS